MAAGIELIRAVNAPATFCASKVRETLRHVAGPPTFPLMVPSDRAGWLRWLWQRVVLEDAHADPPAVAGNPAIAAISRTVKVTKACVSAWTVARAADSPAAWSQARQQCESWKQLPTALQERFAADACDGQDEHVRLPTRATRTSFDCVDQGLVVSLLGAPAPDAMTFANLAAMSIEDADARLLKQAESIDLNRKHLVPAHAWWLKAAEKSPSGIDDLIDQPETLKKQTYFLSERSWIDRDGRLRGTSKIRKGQAFGRLPRLPFADFTSIGCAIVGQLSDPLNLSPEDSERSRILRENADEGRKLLIFDKMNTVDTLKCRLTALIALARPEHATERRMPGMQIRARAVTAAIEAAKTLAARPDAQVLGTNAECRLAAQLGTEKQLASALTRLLARDTDDARGCIESALLARLSRGEVTQARDLLDNQRGRFLAEDGALTERGAALERALAYAEDAHSKPRPAGWLPDQEETEGPSVDPPPLPERQALIESLQTTFDTPDLAWMVDDFARRYP